MSHQREMIEKVASESGDVLSTQVEKPRSLFPEVFVEGQIDFDRLKATLGATAEGRLGRFSFTWAGKDDALALLQTPIRGTLIACPEQSINLDATGNQGLHTSSRSRFPSIVRSLCVGPGSSADRRASEQVGEALGKALADRRFVTYRHQLRPGARPRGGFEMPTQGMTLRLARSPRPGSDSDPSPQ